MYQVYDLLKNSAMMGHYVEWLNIILKTFQLCDASYDVNYENFYTFDNISPMNDHFLLWRR